MVKDVFWGVKVERLEIEIKDGLCSKNKKDMVIYLYGLVIQVSVIKVIISLGHYTSQRLHILTRNEYQVF